MMTQAFYTGLSGLMSQQTAIDIEADNIANISTIGFRGSNAEFASLFERTVVSTMDHSSVGIGSRVQTSSINMQNGAIQLTDRNTDLAISDEGWFGIKDGDNRLFTRAGNFMFDSNSDLVNSDGMYVLGTMANNIEGNVLKKEVLQTQLGDISQQQTLRFPKSLSYPPVSTTHTSFLGNLGVDDETRVFGAVAIDPQNNKNNLKLHFTKSAKQPQEGVQWDIVATTQSLNGETIYDTQKGSAIFNEEGALVSYSIADIDNNGSKIAIDLGDGYNGIVSMNIPYSAGSSQSDGTIGGELVGYEINRNAEVIATFTNGMQSSVGKIALYHFNNEQGLDKISSSTYQESSNSGRAQFYKDSNGNNILGSSVMNFQLETSNVTMSSSLTQLIILQRSYDSNSKVVSTADQMMQKALNMDA